MSDSKKIVVLAATSTNKTNSLAKISAPEPATPEQGELDLG